MKIKRLKDIINYRIDVYLDYKYGLRNYKLIDDNNRKIGGFFIDMVYDDDGVEVFNMGHIQNVWLSEEYRGMGISKLVFNILLNEVRKTGYDSVYLTVKKDNIPAVKLYKSLKFKVIEENQEYYTMYLDI